MGKHLVLLAIFLCTAASAHAQYADVSAAGGPATIKSAWRFHTGDDPQWAAPSYDDSHWSLLRLDKTWAQQGYGGYAGYAWYRIRLKLPATKAPLAIGFTEVNSADEIYADGQLIGTIGKMRPAPVWLGYAPDVHSVPLPPALNGRTVELAVRVWQPQTSANDVAFVGRTTNPRVGAVETIANLHEISMVSLAKTEIPACILSILAAGIGLSSLAFFFLRRRSTEYAWAALFLLCAAALYLGSWLYHTYQWAAFNWIFAATCLNAADLIFWLLFIWRFLRAPADRLLRIGIGILLLVPIPVLLARWDILPLSDANLTWVIVPLALSILVVAHLVRLAWQGNRDAQLLLVPFVFSNLMSAITEASDFLYWVGALKVRRGGAYLMLYRGSSFSITWNWLFDLLSFLAVAVLLMLRFSRSAERDERLSAEIAAAQAVQMQLVPAHMPATPHFRFDAAYFAASEVGGDFYQVFPQSDRSVLIAIGDVSGKGLKAAMLGTLVVGALRSLAQENLSPRDMLARLNLQLTAASEGGFVTCLVMRIAPDGSAVLANAGHLAPYRHGEEMECAAGLPLGITQEATYTESSFTVEPGIAVTLISDGVVEAQNAAGELFGFERTKAISAQSAHQVAQAARDFGQHDDITVLTLTFAPAEALHA